MTLRVLGTDFRLAPLAQRSQLAQWFESHPAETKIFKEAVLLSTCNRVELYIWDEKETEDLKPKMKEEAPELLSPGVLRSLEGSEALRHLFRVTASLESMVVGENQITGQVRKAYEKAVEHGRVGRHLHKIFQESFRAAKRVRNETEVGRLAVSLPSVGVKLAEKIFGALHHRKIAILGLGEIGRVAAEHFVCVSPKSLFLFNRTPDVARELAQDLRPSGVSLEVWSQLDSESLRDCDIIVGAASARLLSRQEIAHIDQDGKERLWIDLGVPSCFEFSGEEKAFTYGIDDLKKIAEENSLYREQELIKAGEIVMDESESLWRRLESADLGELISRLSEKTELFRQAEMLALRQRLGAVGDEDWSEIEKMSSRLSRKILQDPIKELKSRLELAEEKETWVEFFRNIFRI